MSDLVRVGMADFKLCRPPQHISTLGLGSCMGVVIYDTKCKVCGLAHIMLPDSTKINRNTNRYKFVDTCLSDMLAELLKAGAVKKNLVAKIAGGARMFAYDSTNEHLNIGEKNIDATKLFLKQSGIPIVAEDVGAYHGRTIEFWPESGELHIKVADKGSYTI